MKEIRHVGIVVGDMDKMLGFYRDALGMNVVVDSIEKGSYINRIIGLENLRVRILKLSADDGSVIELLKYEELENSSAAKDLWMRGFSHISISVGNVEEEYRRLSTAGLSFNSEPSVSSDGYAKVCFCRDPEGNYIELVEVLK